MKPLYRAMGVSMAVASLTLASAGVQASSHMDAPLITLDTAANTTDVYAFVDEDDGNKSLVVALGVYPFEEPGIGPNKYNFDDNVLYQIHIALGQDSVQAGRADLSYRFRFETRFKNEDTILQSYLGVIENVDDAGQNLTQTYKVTKVDHRKRGHKRRTKLRCRDGYTRVECLVPPNNQGNATPFDNQGDSGEAPAKDGVATEAELDRYTAQTVFDMDRGYTVFAGQRDDGFYADIQAVFDLLRLRPGDPDDSQGGFNLHLIALEIPMSELGGDQQIAGVYATTSRRPFSVVSGNVDDEDSDEDSDEGDFVGGSWVQVGRQGNPLFNEALVAIADKDLYSRTKPTRDVALFSQYAQSPELARLLNALVVPFVPTLQPAVENDRTDIAGIYIPDVIKVDLSTSGARLAGGGEFHPTNPDDEDFSRLSIFGGDLLQSQIQDPLANGGFIPGGWPNGRRFGDDVLDIAVSAVLSDLRSLPLFIQVAGDGVDSNDAVFNKVFPYESTPQNGRIHAHHGEGL